MTEENTPLDSAIDQSDTLDNEPNKAPEVDATLVAAKESVSQLKENINQIIIGQSEVVEQVLIALLANGHLLLEGVPGLGKTMLVRTLAACFGGHFKRIQFTADLMPADVTGHTLYDMKESKFKVRKGPVFTNLLLADEINRSPAKTQAALLEVMQEKQVSIEGESLPLPSPFMVMATQNPIEQEGTYPLPEAELDRFLFKVLMAYPSAKDEFIITQAASSTELHDRLIALEQSPLLSAAQLTELQQRCETITADDAVINYAVNIVRATRSNAGIANGAGPRASIGLIKAARAVALMAGRDFLLPDDVKRVALPVLRHRINITADMEIEGMNADSLLQSLLNTVEAPRA